MKKIFVLMLVVMVSLALSGTVYAVGSGKTLEFPDKDQGKVTFDGTSHAKAGLKCNDCHPAIFKMKKETGKMTMKEMNEGKFCGACHNGTKAFSTKECAKCHKK